AVRAPLALGRLRRFGEIELDVQLEIRVLLLRHDASLADLEDALGDRPGGGLSVLVDELRRVQDRRPFRSLLMNREQQGRQRERLHHRTFRMSSRCFGMPVRGSSAASYSSVMNPR